MRRWLAELRRAPVRIATSIVALALAVGAIGVFAIPAVSTSSLRDAAARDRLADITLDTTDTGAPAVDALGDVPNVTAVEGQVVAHVLAADGRSLVVLGKDLSTQRLDVVAVDEGRLPDAPGEVVVADGLAGVGDRVDVTGPDGGTTSLTVVGVGGTRSGTDADVVYAPTGTAAALADVSGVNRVVVAAEDTTAEALDRTADALRIRLSTDGVELTELSETRPGGRHPIEADIAQVSSLVGLLGVVAGLVALVLLGSTTNTLISERTREVAVMRALGARPRPLRRRLRRLAVGIAAVAVVIGVPLGVVVSNVIARMVLQEFVGITPGLAVSVPVMVGSALFALVGAQLVAARAARRVTRLELATALRDRDGNPYGRRRSERLAARLPGGRLLDRVAWRDGLHRRSRSLAILAQITAAVAALLTIASLATTVNEFDDAQYDGWNWATRTSVIGPGLDVDDRVADADPRSEVAAFVAGEHDGWEVDVVGLARHTAMIDPELDAGRWFDGPGEAVVATGYADRVGVAVGDAMDVRLASGTHEYRVTGLHPTIGRTVLLDRDGLAADLGSPGRGNVLLSLDTTPATILDGPTEVVGLSQLNGDDSGRRAIVLIFAAIGAVVVSVAGLAVLSGLAVNVHERRRELAALQAIGGRRRHVFRVVLAELAPLAVAGCGLGLVAGYLGARAIIGSFEASNAVEIGFTFASGAIPAAVAVVVVGSVLVSGLMVRRVTRRPPAVTLRSAT